VQLDALDRSHGWLDLIELADRWTVGRRRGPKAIDMIDGEARHVTLLDALRPVASTERREEPSEAEMRAGAQPGSGDRDQSEANKGRNELDRRGHASIVARLSSGAPRIRTAGSEENQAP